MTQQQQARMQMQMMPVADTAAVPFRQLSPGDLEFRLQPTAPVVAAPNEEGVTESEDLLLFRSSLHGDEVEREVAAQRRGYRKEEPGEAEPQGNRDDDQTEDARIRATEPLERRREARGDGAQPIRIATGGDDRWEQCDERNLKGRPLAGPSRASIRAERRRQQVADAEMKKIKEENDIRDYGSKQHEESRLVKDRLYKKRKIDWARQILFIERRERWKDEVK
jgi:hypothetical protein